MAIGLTMDLHNEIEKICKERDEMAVKQGLTSLFDMTYQQELKAVEHKKSDDEQKRKDKGHKRARDQYLAAKKQASKRPKVRRHAGGVVVCASW